MTAVVTYFEKKTLQATSAAAIITEDAKVKTTAAATKTAKGLRDAAKTASNTADANSTAAWKNLMAHMMAGKA